MRKALVVGIDFYFDPRVSQLRGCAADANAVCRVLEKHGDDTVNFGVELRTATHYSSALSKRELKDLVRDLFRDDSEIALLYFSGHGHAEVTGGYLCASDCATGDDGLSLDEVAGMANASPARNKIILLDSCFSGIAGNLSADQRTAQLAEGITFLTASTQDQYAVGGDGGGLFTNLLVDALSGGAANLVGDVTPGGVYAHIDQSLGPWKQRPVFKTNVKKFVSLRHVRAPILLGDLQKIAKLFPAPDFVFNLDPSFEPELRGRPTGVVAPDPVNTAIFRVLQSYRDVNLLTPLGAEHMWNAAIESRACKLTRLGEHYRRLVSERLI